MVVVSRGYYEAWRDVHPALWTGTHPSFEDVLACSHKIQKIWDKRRGNDLLEKAVILTGIKWQRPEIRCYVIGRHESSWSDPMTVPSTIIKESDDYCFGDLIHEAIHVLISDGCGDWIENYLSWAFPGESHTTQIHVIVHAIHRSLGAEAGETHLAHRADYERSWEIVLGKGHERIVWDFREMAAKSASHHRG